MRILIVHNYYQDPGGEDTVVAQEKALLSTVGEVSLLTYQNRKGWRGLIQTALVPWNIFAARKLKEVIRKFRPDVVHIHNLHYAIGPIAVRVTKRRGIPVVMTLHNYRLLCPSATLFHKGKPFTDSLRRNFPWDAVRLGIHSASIVKTFWFATTNWLHRQLGTWKQVDYYITLTAFAKQLVENSTLGVRPVQLTVKQNFLSSEITEPEMERQDYFLFVGRLAEEKGVRMMLQSFADTGAKLMIAGDGPLKPLVQTYQQAYPNIQYAGAVDRQEVHRLMRTSTALIFPSIWYEGMPMTIIESFASSTPVIASDLGAMQTMISDGRTGLLTTPGYADALSQNVKKWLEMEPDDKQKMGIAARLEFDTKYSQDINLQLLLRVYQQAIAMSDRKT